MENRRYPSVTSLANSLDRRYSESIRVFASQFAIAEKRKGVAAALEVLAQIKCRDLAGENLLRLMNGSGVILHTGLGRARLAETAAGAISEVANGHASVEFEISTGKRGDRQDHVEELLCELTGAEAAMVVNNCAGALILTLSALCSGQEVVLSRGQMVEIGGSFRVPGIIVQSGCRLREVGCTNRTRLSDFIEVTGEETAAWLTCHQSNFAMTGFVGFPEHGELAQAAARAAVMWIDDMGSGCLVDTRRFGLPYERRLSDSVSQGACVSLASGDKLLGGPQAGIIVGKKESVRKIKSHPLARALRIDKLCLAGLAATLRMYFEGREFEIPVWKSVAKPLDEVKSMAERIAEVVPGSVISECMTELGGGSMPGAGVPSWRCGWASDDLDAELRKLRCEIGIVGRIEHGKVWIDPRTLESFEFAELVKRLEHH